MKRSLPDGLVLRSLSEGHTSDRENLGTFFRDVFNETEEWTEDDQAWTEGLIAGEHPTISSDDVWVVVDQAKNDQIVSGMLLIPQVWRYEGIDIPVGRPEVVATHPDYRNRGLIRALFEVCHERSVALGHQIQGITGIAFYYRQFGYAMAVDLEGHGVVPMYGIAKLDDKKAPVYTLRPAIEADYAQLDAWDQEAASQFVLSAVRDEVLWRWQVDNRKFIMQIIVDADQQDVGYIGLYRDPKTPWIYCMAYVLGNKASYLSTYEDVLRGIQAFCKATYAEDDQPQFVGIEEGQPEVLSILLERTEQANLSSRRYAWYLRLTDPAQFILTIKTVLEQRTAESDAHHYTGELKIDFFNLRGLSIKFEDGCITATENIDLRKPLDQQGCDAGFPYETFLQLVFGYRNWREIQYILPECYANPKADVLFHVLFPKKPSRLLAIT